MKETIKFEVNDLDTDEKYYVSNWTEGKDATAKSAIQEAMKLNDVITMGHTIIRPVREERVIKFHRHGGYYNDGNSNYWAEDSELDLVTGILKTKREETWGGQLASNGNHSEKKEESEIKAVPFKKETEEKIYDTLLPFIELTEKYPHLDTFRFFSQKHKWFVTGRMRKAVKLALADESNYYGVNCLKDIFVLTTKGIIVTTHFEDSRNHSYFLVRVEKIQ